MSTREILFGWKKRASNHFYSAQGFCNPILLLQMNDRYEAFYEDAGVVSRIMGVRTENRPIQSNEIVEVVGIPLYLKGICCQKLLRDGHTVAIVSDIATSNGTSRSVVQKLVPETKP